MLKNAAICLVSSHISNNLLCGLFCYQNINEVSKISLFRASGYIIITGRQKGQYVHYTSQDICNMMNFS